VNFVHLRGARNRACKAFFSATMIACLGAKQVHYAIDFLG